MMVKEEVAKRLVTNRRQRNNQADCLQIKIKDRRLDKIGVRVRVRVRVRVNLCALDDTLHATKVSRCPPPLSDHHPPSEVPQLPLLGPL